MKKIGLRLKKKKRVLVASKVTYLGFRANESGANLLPEKVADLLNAETPKNATQLESFLDMLKYYHRHLPNLAHILEPLHKLLRKSSKWNWGRVQKQSFEKIKEILCSVKFLIHYKPKKPLVLVCDTSLYKLGTALSILYLMDQENRSLFIWDTITS